MVFGCSLSYDRQGFSFETMMVDVVGCRGGEGEATPSLRFSPSSSSKYYCLLRVTGVAGLNVEDAIGHKGGNRS